MEQRLMTEDWLMTLYEITISTWDKAELAKLVDRLEEQEQIFIGSDLSSGEESELYTMFSKIYGIARQKLFNLEGQYRSNLGRIATEAIATITTKEEFNEFMVKLKATYKPDVSSPAMLEVYYRTVEMLNKHAELRLNG